MGLENLETAGLEQLQELLLDDTAPIANRIHAVFMVRKIGTKEGIDLLGKTMYVPSVLLAHEAAFVLGQIGDTHAVAALSAVLRNAELNCVVRHEAAEALAAIGAQDAVPILREHLSDPSQEVAETCQIALDKLAWLQENGGVEDESSTFKTVDPAPASKSKDIPALQAQLIDASLPLFKRYQAMFALRNLCSDEAVRALAMGFQEASSALFRHEIAYVMGQLQHPAAIEALTEVLKNSEEHAMVRHEAAEALGSIGDQTLPLLKEYQHDKDKIVRESCDVALSITEYWNDFEGTEAAEKAETEDAAKPQQSPEGQGEDKQRSGVKPRRARRRRRRIRRRVKKKIKRKTKAVVK